MSLNWINLGLGILTIVLDAIILGYVYMNDSPEDKEPIPLLLLLVLSGALGGLAAGALNGANALMLEEYCGVTKATRPFIAALFVGICEEGIKLFFLKRITWRQRNFNYLFDGMIYAAAVGVGFQMEETIDYAVRLGGGILEVVCRCLTQGHLLFAVLMGAFYTGARTFFNKGKGLLGTILLILSYIVPVMVHTLWDYYCFLKENGASLTKWLMGAFVGVLVMTAMILINHYSYKDREITV